MSSIGLEMLSDSEIRIRLIGLGFKNIGPVNSRTRRVHLKKLKRTLEKYEKGIAQEDGPDKSKPSGNVLVLKSPDKYDPINISSPTKLSESSITPGTRKAKRSTQIIIQGIKVRKPRDLKKSTPVRESISKLEAMPTGVSPMEVETPSSSGGNCNRMNPDELPSTSFMFGDENEDFANMIAKKLRKYDSRTQNIIQNEITSIFIKADSGYYEPA